ncbi:uncharacterized protein [Eucyclogobius newberryi]|uniref:uncharacterized protein n=1 Tax=Eucyclogobius newberryi TaxID=166745 RepID=UPI003B59C3D0
MEKHSTSAPSASTSVEIKWSKYMTESLKLSDGPPACYQLEVKRENLDGESDEESKLSKFTLGTRDPEHPNKTILLVGETGSGKSTLVNALVNFVMGVKFEDKVWFQMIPDETVRPKSQSQTSEVSVYEVFGFEGTVVPYSLTIIDTPGYGDTRGIEHDEIITKKLLELFKAPDEVSGVKSMDAVGLVLKSSQNRLDERIAYVFNSITSIFGKDMDKNIVAMVTYSDGMEPKNVFEVLDDANIKYARDEDNEPIYFLFNNRQKDKRGKKKEKTAAQYAFKISEDGMSEFTDFLVECEPRSLEETKKVLKERTRLTACIENFKERVNHIEIQQEAIKMTKEKLNKLTQDVSNSKIEKTETYKDKEACNMKALSCTTCEETCHKECPLAFYKPWCVVMKLGKCTVCSRKCPAGEHVRERWRYVTKTRKVEVTSEEMKRRYDAEAKSEVKKTLLEDLQEEVEQLQRDKNKCLDDAFEAIEKLEKIALNADSVSTYVHLDFLIEKMKEKKDTEKTTKLEEIKANIQTTSKGGASYSARRHKT